MNRSLLLAAAPLLAWTALASAAPPAAVTPPVPGAPALSPPVPSPPAPSPGEIVAAASPAEWRAIAPADLLVMDLAPGGAGRGGGKPHQVVIQLMPPRFAQGWIGNIRRLAAAHWWDGTSVNRVQDNYVVQWGDADGEDKAKAKPLPAGLAVVPESDYEVFSNGPAENGKVTAWHPIRPITDVYADWTSFEHGWPVAHRTENNDAILETWPVHCYGMVGVGRNLSPDTGSGAELYTVIGHAPRHLDRNIALVGRVIEGIEFLSSLPRGTGALGFYETAEERTPIVAVRLGNEVPGLPAFQYLSTESVSFARYADARANRRDPFFIRPAGGADICNIPVPVRQMPAVK